MKALGHEKDWALVPSDKTNRWLPVQVEEYIKWMNEHLDDKCSVISQEHLTETYEDALALLEKFRDMMDEGEAEYIETWIRTR